MEFLPMNRSVRLVKFLKDVIFTCAGYWVHAQALSTKMVVVFALHVPKPLISPTAIAFQI